MKWKPVVELKNGQLAPCNYLPDTESEVYDRNLSKYWIPVPVFTGTSFHGNDEKS